MAERNFDTDRKKAVREGHSFTLGGREFRTLPDLPVSWLLRPKDDDPEVSPLERNINFLRMLIVPEQREAFDGLLADDDVFLEASDLLDVSKWLIGVISSNRPTSASGSSGNGAGRTGKLSRVKRSSVAPASKTSAGKRPSP